MEVVKGRESMLVKGMTGLRTKCIVTDLTINECGRKVIMYNSASIEVRRSRNVYGITEIDLPEELGSN